MKKVPLTIRLDCQPGDIEFAKDDSGDEPKLATFSMVAYTGGEVIHWGDRFVIDLSGMKIASETLPVRLNHDPNQGVGHTLTAEVKNERRLLVQGVVSRATEAARDVVASALNGFPWQASVGANILKSEFIAEDVDVRVNGRKFAGPLFVLRKTSLEEVSFVDRGADNKTSAKVAAQEAAGGKDMKEDGKVEGKGTATAAAESEKVTTAVPKVVETAAVIPDKPKVETAAPKEEGAVQTEGLSDMVTQYRTVAAAEVERIAAIRKLCTGGSPEIEAKAISEGWNTDRCELEQLRAARPRVPAVHSGGDPLTGQVLEAACLVSGKHPNVEKLYDEKVLDLAQKRFRGAISLQELLLEAAWANGFTGRTFRQVQDIMRAAFGRGQIQAAGSLIDLPGILGNVANTFLLEGFFSVEQIWKTVSAQRPVTDFKTISSYRLTGVDQYELVPPGGEIKHGTLTEETFTNKADTYGLMLAIDRRDIINDDLGALTSMPRKLGRGSGLKINDIFWTAFMDNSTFFVAGNNNYIVDYPLAINGLTTGEQTFMDQVDANGKPIGTMPAILLVPTGLSAIGAQLFNSTELRDTTSSTKYPVANPHAGKYAVQVSAYLGNSNYTGNSQLAWYLLANPADLAVIEVVFLNGQEAPTVQTADADFNILGILLRGFHDFGVTKQDPKGGMKSKGEA